MLLTEKKLFSNVSVFEYQCSHLKEAYIGVNTKSQTTSAFLLTFGHRDLRQNSMKCGHCVVTTSICTVFVPNCFDVM